MRNYCSELVALIAPHEHRTLTHITHHIPSPVITNSTIIPKEAVAIIFITTTIKQIGVHPNPAH